jgi:hypothetical protein
MTGVRRFRKRPVVVSGVLWTGSNYGEIQAFAVSPGCGGCCRWRGGTGLDLWNDQEQAWIPCPAGHTVMKGVLGEFYPVSPAALAETFDPAGEDGRMQELSRAGAAAVADDDIDDEEEC